MLAVFLAFALATAGSPQGIMQANPSHGDVATFVLAEDIAPRENLRTSLMAPLMDKFHAMNDAGQGIFQHDITSIVAPYFPPGQRFADTQRILKEQNLGTLQKFQGMQDSPGATMYVAKFSLMNGTFSEVYVVLNFDFAGKSEADMVVTKAGGFLRAGAM